MERHAMLAHEDDTETGVVVVVMEGVQNVRRTYPLCVLANFVVAKQIIVVRTQRLTVKPVPGVPISGDPDHVVSRDFIPLHF